MSGEASGSGSSLVLYRTEDGQTRIECRFEGETLWLTQALMAELFQITVSTVNEHLKALVAEGEIEPSATIRKLRIVRMESARRVSREIEHYALPVVVAVGYRVRSPRGTQFRQWATARLTEFLAKGFTLDDPRLKHPPGPGVPDYFDELLERIRDIRASQARMYTRVRDLLALAVDYAPSATETHRLFQVVQNKLHHAVTGMTAPELIAARADASQPNMGLTSWKSGAVRRADVTIAKNYLREGEIGELNRIVVMFLDYAEDQARRKQPVHLKEWQRKLDEFLKFNERAVLPDAGRVSREAADQKAIAEFERFAEQRRGLAEAKGEEEALKAIEELAKRKAEPKGRVGAEEKAEKKANAGKSAKVKASGAGEAGRASKASRGPRSES